MRVVSLLSGGLDSTVLLYYLANRGDVVQCLSVDYGQRHRRELEAASLIARRAGVEHRVVDLSGIRPLLAGSALTDDIAVPHGHYTDATQRVTVVPNRNMAMLSVAASWALASGCEAVAYAAHRGDRAVYPDCRPGFVEALGSALRLCDERSMQLLAPFLAMDKRAVVQLGRSLAVPLEVTWSCYQGAEVPCGRCGACVERAEALEDT